MKQTKLLVVPCDWHQDLKGKGLPSSTYLIEPCSLIRVPNIPNSRFFSGTAYTRHEFRLIPES
jgi:hypothetical protein